MVNRVGNEREERKETLEIGGEINKPIVVVILCRWQRRLPQRHAQCVTRGLPTLEFENDRATQRSFQIHQRRQGRRGGVKAVYHSLVVALGAEAGLCACLPSREGLVVCQSRMASQKALTVFSGAAPFAVAKSLITKRPRATCKHHGGGMSAVCEMYTSISYPESREMLHLKITSARVARLAGSVARFDCPAQPDAYETLQA